MTKPTKRLPVAIYITPQGKILRPVPGGKPETPKPDKPKG